MERLETRRLVLRRLVLEDAPFILELVNDQDWLRFIGDKGVRTLADARDYLKKGPLDMYARLGFGLGAVSLKDGTPIGMCGLLKRETLADVDLGFAFLPAYRGRGYAHEAASASLADGRERLGLKKVLAIVSPDNVRSISLLERLGFSWDKNIQLGDGHAQTALYAWRPDCYHGTVR